MSLRNLQDRLEALGDAAIYISPDLNRGGCCAFAAMVSKQLWKHGIYSSGFVGDGWDEYDLDRIRCNVRNPRNARDWNGNGVSFTHVALEVVIGNKVVLWDSDRLTPRLPNFGRYIVSNGRLTPDEMAGIYRTGEWNSDFSRSTLPALSRLVEKYLSPGDNWRNRMEVVS